MAGDDVGPADHLLQSLAAPTPGTSHLPWRLAHSLVVDCGAAGGGGSSGVRAGQPGGAAGGLLGASRALHPGGPHQTSPPVPIQGPAREEPGVAHCDQSLESRHHRPR